MPTLAEHVLGDLETQIGDVERRLERAVGKAGLDSSALNRAAAKLERSVRPKHALLQTLFATPGPHSARVTELDERVRRLLLRLLELKEPGRGQGDPPDLLIEQVREVLEGRRELSQTAMMLTDSSAMSTISAPGAAHGGDPMLATALVIGYLSGVLLDLANALAFGRRGKKS